MDNKLAEQIKNMSIECGYDSCGIISIEKTTDFHNRLHERIKKVPVSGVMYKALGLDNTKRKFPWAKSIIICTFDQGRYRFPQELQGKFSKTYLIVSECDMNPEIIQKRRAFEKWFSDNGIRYAGGSEFGHASIGPLRYFAEIAGLGIARKNNFLYSEQGSFISLIGYVIDQECELIHRLDLKPCSEHCDLCKRACPTNALSEPFTVNPFKCVSFISTFGKGIVPPGLKKAQMDEWVMGCDACQDACPYNKKHDWTKGEDIPSLRNISTKILPDNLISASDDFLKKEVVPRSDNHIKESEIDTIRRCAKISLSNKKRKQNTE